MPRKRKNAKNKAAKDGGGVPLIRGKLFNQNSIKEVRKSEDEGWSRALDKYSPSKQTGLSPLKATEGNVYSVLMNDQYVESLTWIIYMSEQHLYDNSFLLLSYAKSSNRKVATILHRNFIGVDMKFFSNLGETTFIGKGGFGNVYSCRDVRTNIKYVVKHIFGPYRNYSDHTNSLLAYMSERNANLRATDSPFVIKLFYSLQLQSTGHLFLFFEFCIGDLVNFIRLIFYKDQYKLSNMLYHNQPSIIQGLYDKQEEVLEACFIYIFELFCGLDFLVRCNIVHLDIKPENIMISQTLHIKIGDLGLAYKTRAIHKTTNTFLVNSDQLKQVDDQNYSIPLAGTFEFQDFEFQLLHIERDEPELLRDILYDKSKFDADTIDFSKDVLKPCFLVDTWSAGIIAVGLLFRGFKLFNSKYMDTEVYRDVPRIPLRLFTVHLVGRKEIYNRYINRGFIEAGGVQLRDFMKFIASIFRPRLTRCEGYIREKEVYHFSKLVTMKYIDLDKVEKIKVFSERGFCRSNIHLRSISERIRSSFVTRTPENKRFEQLLKDIEDANRSKNTCGYSVVKLNPGVTINLF